MAAEGLLHDLGVIAMLSSDSQGMGRVGEVVRRAFQNAARCAPSAAPARGPPTTSACCATSRRSRSTRPSPRPRRARRLARARQARRRRALAAPFLRRATRARAQGRHRAYGASGEGNASTLLAEPVAPAQAGRRLRRARPRCSRSRSWRAPPSTPTCRRRASASPSRLPRPHRGEHGPPRPHGEVRVDPRTHAVTLDGEPLAAPPLEEVALSGRTARMTEPDPDELASALVEETVDLAFELHAAIAPLSRQGAALHLAAPVAAIFEQPAGRRQAASPGRAPVGRARRAGRRRRRVRARARLLPAGPGQSGARAARVGVLLRLLRRPPQRRVRARAASRPRGPDRAGLDPRRLRCRIRCCLWTRP